MHGEYLAGLWFLASSIGPVAMCTALSPSLPHEHKLACTPDEHEFSNMI